MRVIDGNDNYLLYLDQFGDVIDGVFIEKGTSIVTNHEDVTGETIEVLNADEISEF